jgi:hypothetical protein
LRTRWQDLFATKFDVLLYDLTSTYFESPPPADEADKRRHGYSRDKRSDCVQVVIRAYFMANPTTVQAKVETSTLLANASGKNSPQLRLCQGARGGNDEIGMAVFM